MNSLTMDAILARLKRPHGMMNPGGLDQPREPRFRRGSCPG